MVEIPSIFPFSFKWRWSWKWNVYLQRILRSLGLYSIFCENIEDILGDRVLSYKKIDRSNRNQILLVHYSIL